jgi:hypothetical protein
MEGSLDITAPPPGTPPVAEALVRDCSCCPASIDVPPQAPLFSRSTLVDVCFLPLGTCPVVEGPVPTYSCCQVYVNSLLRGFSPSGSRFEDVNALTPHTCPVVKVLLQVIHAAQSVWMLLAARRVSDLASVRILIVTLCISQVVHNLQQ